MTFTEQKQQRIKELQKLILGSIRDNARDHADRTQTPLEEKQFADALQPGIQLLKELDPRENFSKLVSLQDPANILIAAIENGNLELVKLLDQQGASFQEASFQGSITHSTLHAAIKNPKVLQWILETKAGEIDPNLQIGLESAFLWAARDKHYESVKIFLQHGVDPFKSDQGSFNNSFMQALHDEKLLLPFLQYPNDLEANLNNPYVLNMIFPDNAPMNQFILLSLILAFPHSKLAEIIGRDYNWPNSVQHNINSWGSWFKAENINPFKIFKPDLEKLLNTLSTIDALPSPIKEILVEIIRDHRQYSPERIISLLMNPAYHFLINTLDIPIAF